MFGPTFGFKTSQYFQNKEWKYNNPLGFYLLHKRNLHHLTLLWIWQINLQWSPMGSVQCWSLQCLSNAILTVYFILFYLLLRGGTSNKCALQSCHPSQRRPLQELHVSKYTRCNLQFAYLDSNLGTLAHFQIPIFLQFRLCNFGLANTTICEHGFSKDNCMKSHRKSWLKLETLNALMQVSLCRLPIDYGLG